MPLFEIPAATRANTSRSRDVRRAERCWTIRFTVAVTVAAPPTARPSSRASMPALTARPAPFAYLDRDRPGFAAATQLQLQQAAWAQLGNLRGKSFHVIDRRAVDRLQQIPRCESGCLGR